MAVGDIYELVTTTFGDQQIGVNVLHYVVSASTPPEPAIFIVASQASVIFGPLYIALLNVNFEYNSLSAQRIRPLPVGAKAISTSAQGPGVVAGDPLPKQTSGLIAKRTSLGGRRNRGRAYVAFPAEDDSTGNAQPSPGYVAALGNLANQMAAVIVVADGPGSITLQPVVFSRTAPETATPITNCTPSDFWATQRRRGDFGRPNMPPA